MEERPTLDSIIETIKRTPQFDNMRKAINGHLYEMGADRRIKARTQQYIRERNLVETLSAEDIPLQENIEKEIRRSETIKQAVLDEIEVIVFGSVRSNPIGMKEAVRRAVEDAVRKHPQWVTDFRPPPPPPIPHGPVMPLGAHPYPPPPPPYHYDPVMVGHKRKYFDAGYPPPKHHKGHGYPPYYH